MTDTKKGIPLTEAFGSIVRHFLTALAGALAIWGVEISEDEIATITGGLVAAAGVGWSLYIKRRG